VVFFLFLFIQIEVGNLQIFFHHRRSVWCVQGKSTAAVRLHQGKIQRIGCGKNHNHEDIRRRQEGQQKVFHFRPCFVPYELL